MGAPKGSKNALGHNGKGTGRKPLPVEMAQRQKETELMYEQQDVEEVLTRIKQKKYSVRDAMLAKELKGNESLIGKHYQKVVPDKVDVTSGGEKMGIIYLPQRENERLETTTETRNSPNQK